MKANPPISYKLFKECIDSIEKQLKSEQEHAENLAKCFPNANSADFMLESDFATNQLIKVLETLFNDKSEWIKHYLFELNFGRENWRLKVYENNKEVSLSTVKDLFNLLISNLNSN